MEDDLNFLKMEDNLNFFEMENDHIVLDGIEVPPNRLPNLHLFEYPASYVHVPRLIS